MHYRFGVRLPLVIDDGQLVLEELRDSGRQVVDLKLFNNFRLGYLMLKSKKLAIEPIDLLERKERVTLLEYYQLRATKDAYEASS